MSSAEVYVERFIIKKFNSVEVQEHYRVQISIWCPIFEKKKKKLYDYVDTVKLLWLQNPSQMNVRNLNKRMG